MLAIEAAILWFAVHRPSVLENCCGVIFFLAGVFSGANGLAALLFCFTSNTHRVLRLARKGVIAGSIAILAAVGGTLTHELLVDKANPGSTELLEELLVIIIAAAVIVLSLGARKIALARRRPPPLPP